MTVSAYTEVEADTLKKSIAIAKNREVAIGGINACIDPTEMQPIVWALTDRQIRST